jgi:hypothetical protein
MSHQLSVRLNDATIARLGERAQRAHIAPHTLAQRYVEEGLRLDEHPIIRFAGALPGGALDSVSHLVVVTTSLSSGYLRGHPGHRYAHCDGHH